MIVSAEVHNPDDMEVTLTLRLRLRDWKTLADQLHTRWPSGVLSRTINELILRVERQITGTVDENEPDSLRP